MIELQIEAIPADLHAGLQAHWQRICDACSEEQARLISEKLSASAPLSQQLALCLTVSHYLAKLWVLKPQFLCDLLADSSLLQDVEQGHYAQQLAAEESPINEMALDTRLRQFRHQQMGRFIFRNANRLTSTRQLIRELSWFADACIDKAVSWHYADLVGKHGTPMGDESAEPQPFVVLGMGKLGAYELNLSSDIDLIFCYPEMGETTGENNSGRKSLNNHTFFLRLGQQVIKSLDKVTGDGFVFRVDMRLRPYGQSGLLAMNFDAMELYYEEQGREWERYAMIKARCVAGSIDAGKAILTRLRPFVYRRYTDFSAIQALREMKALINREVRRLGKQNDVKLGAGGIREIEFIAQAYQLIYGGRDEELQERSVLHVLDCLGQRQLLPAGAAEELMDAYFFLRDAEHAIQSLNDEQTQRLPVDEPAQQRMVLAMGFRDWSGFIAELDKHRAHVRKHFENVIAEPEEEDGNELDEWRKIWLDPNQECFEKALAEQGFNAEEIRHLSLLKNDSRLLKMEKISLERIHAFMPHFLSIVHNTVERGNCVAGLTALIEAVLRRTAYLVLLNENPKALQRLVIVAKASPWVMQQLVRHPVLLDELLGVEGLGHVPEPAELRESLQQQSLRLNIDDMEGHMQMLRYFRLSHHLHIVAAEASGKLPLMKVSDYLSFLADAILEYVLQLAWLQMVERYGYPTLNSEPCTEPTFAIIGYGKLGGLEMSHSSDLDLVFLYDTDEGGETDGEKPVDNRLFFTRMGQRIIHLLTTPTVLGKLYEVDMRLRPSGGKGLLVSNIASFATYQEQEAWTWEHQALVRGRPIAGSAELIDQFQTIRQQILTRPRDQAQLRQEVVDMRQRMYEQRAPGYTKAADAKVFHLKHSRGGIVDIEFLVQYLVLAHSHQHPELVRYTDNIRILKALAKARIMTSEAAEQLTEAYQAYRSEGHKLALKQEKNEALVADFAPCLQAVTTIWDKYFS